MAEAKPEGVAEFTFPDEKGEVTEITKPAEGEELNAGAETDVNIEIVDDTPPEDRGRKPGVSREIPDVTDEELQKHSVDVQKRLKSLGLARHDERRAKEAALRSEEEAVRVARAVSEENKRLREYVQNGEKAYAGTAKNAAQARLKIAEGKYKAAHEAFDADALIAAQQEMTAAQFELHAAENFKPLALQDEKSGYTDPTQQAQPDEKAVRWKAENSWFGADEEMTALALATHKKLVNSGVDPQSDVYYKRIDARIREKFPENFEGTSVEPAPSHRKPASVVAPTARSSSAKKVTLTQTQVNLASKLGIPLAEYAKQVAILETNNVR